MRITGCSLKNASNRMRVVVITLLCFFSAGCALIDGAAESVKTVWGSSTRALERVRYKAISKTYDKPYWDVVRAAINAAEHNRYVIFKRDDVQGYCVLMGIPGSVNTTEVGVFFAEISESQTRVEVASLSTNAKRFASKGLFHAMDVEFGLAPPDPAPAESSAPNQS